MNDEGAKREEFTMKTLHIRNWAEGYTWLRKSEADALEMVLSVFSKKKKGNYESERIKQKEKEERENAPMKKLLKDLYECSLKDDPKFHFFYEPEIIIRFSSQDSLDKAVKLLEERNIQYVIYEYPSPEKSPMHPTYGEEPSGIVLKYFELFLTIFHAHSIAAITMDDSDHFDCVIEHFSI